MARFRFAVQLTGAADGRAWRELARRVEDLGYSTLYVPDHLGDQWDPLVAMCVAAEATSQLKVGSLVFDNDFRHPVVLAKQVATLDLACEGRVEFGLGAGWLRSDYQASGIPYDPAGVRVERMAESLAVMKALWSEGKVTFSGRHYQVDVPTAAPLPRSRPYPTIVIGGGSPKVLSLAAREADVVGINPNLAAGEVNAEVTASARAERFRERVAWVRQAAGERFGRLELQCLTFAVQVVPNAAQVLESVAPLFGVTPEDAAEMPIVLVGSEAEIAARLQQRREEYGFSYWVVHQAEMEAFAPVVARLAGT